MTDAVEATAPVPDDAELKRLARHLAAVLTDRGMRLAIAESCTGGWLAKTLTDLPGSSTWFDYGFVTYGDGAKSSLLGVSPETLQVHGAVSQDVAEQMATGARLASGAEIAVAITGIAGPGGGSAEKPVGTVWFAWAGPGPHLVADRACFAGDREAVRRQAVAAALAGLVRQIDPA